MFLGRDIAAPVAMEGALKLKEITLPAGGRVRGGRDEARPDRADRRGHARRRRRRPARRCTTGSPRTCEEVAARGARVIAVVDDEDSPAGRLAAHRFTVPARRLAAVAAAVGGADAAARLRARGRAGARTWTSRATSPRRSPSNRDETEAFGGRARGRRDHGGGRRRERAGRPEPAVRSPTGRGPVAPGTSGSRSPGAARVVSWTAARAGRSRIVFYRVERDGRYRCAACAARA